jgi:hypothetical protein
MSEVVTQLSLTAVDKTQNAFKQAAQTIERFTQQTAKAHKELAATQKTAMASIVESGRSTFDSLVGLGAKITGITLGFEAMKESVKVFANLDQQQRALSVSTGAHLAKIKEFYEVVNEASTREKVNQEDLQKSFYKLSQAFGPEAAAQLIGNVAKAGAALGDVSAATLFAIQSLKNLKITASEAFDTIITSAQGARIPADQLAAAISTISPEMNKLGEHGEKGLRRVAAMFETMGNKAVSAEAATETMATIMDTIGTPRGQAAFQKWGGTNLKALLNEGARRGHDPLENFIKATDSALKHMAQREGVDQSQRFRYLDQLIRNPGARAGMQALIEDAEKSGGQVARGRDRTRAEEAGATGRAAALMTGGASGDISTLGNIKQEAQEQAGGFFVDLAKAELRGIERARRALGFGPKTESSPFGSLYGPGGARPAGLTGGGFGAALRGDITTDTFRKLNEQNNNVLIPHAPGSATEQTARDQLITLKSIDQTTRVWRRAWRWRV